MAKDDYSTLGDSNTYGYQTTNISVNGLEMGLYKIVDEEAAPFVGYVPDLHVSTSTLENLLTEVSSKGKGYERAYIAISDVDDKTNSRMEFFQKHNLTDEKQAEISYFASKLEDGLGDAYFMLETMKKHGGVDNYLNLLRENGYQGVDIEKFQKQYDDSVKLAKDGNLEEKIQEVAKTITPEEQEQFIINNLRNRAFNYACTKVNMEKLAPVLDEYNLRVKNGEIDGPEIVAIKGGGNHDSLDSYNTLNEATKHTTIHHINDIGGAIELGRGNEKINFQLGSNCYSSTPVGDTFGLSSEEVFLQSSPHTYDFTLTQDYTYGDIDTKYDKEQIRLNSKEYQRFTFGMTDSTKLDFMLYHQGLGYDEPGYENLTQKEHHVSNLGLILHNEEFVKARDDGYKVQYSGHFHSGLEGYLDEEQKQVRNRFDGSIISKDGAEKLNLGPHSNVEYIEQDVFTHAEVKFVELVEQYNQHALDMQQQTANDSSSEEDQKAA